MRKAVVTGVACVVIAVIVALVLISHRWAPLRGPSYGSERGPFRAEGSIAPEAIAGEPAYRLVLIGDAGAPEPEDPTLALLGRWADAHPTRTTVIFLGDNVYPAGLRASDRSHGERILLQLIGSTRASKIFLPGNHDWGFTWNRSDPDVLARQQEFVEERADLRADFEPEDGCPGPVALELIEPVPGLLGGLTVLALDLHWWLLEESDRPACEGIDTTSAFLEVFRAELEARRHDNVVVAAHHPIRSGGPHGGYTRGFWRDLGMALFYRLYAVQDLIEPGYQEAVTLLSEVLSENPPLAMVGGHDHSLQILDGGDEARLVVVSGSATRVSPVTPIEGTLFAHAERGFIVFDFHRGDAGNARGTLFVQVVEVGHEGPVAAIAIDLARKEKPPEAVVPAR